MKRRKSEKVEVIPEVDPRERIAQFRQYAGTYGNPSLYENACRRALDAEGFPDVPWQVLEAYMRDIYGCLDAQPHAVFRQHAGQAAHFWHDTPDAARELVASHSLPVII